MRAQAKQARHEEEEESAFVSMTDMTVGFLFIMMILLAFFASQIRDTETVPKSALDAAIAQRDIFERERNEWRELAEDRAERIEELEELLTRLEREKADLMEQIQALNLKQDELTQQIDDLTRERDQLEQELAWARNEIADLEKEIETLDQSLKDAMNKIARLEKRIEDMIRRLREMNIVDPLESYLARVAQSRRMVLMQLRDAIRADFPDLQVELSEESDALRFQGEGLFASGQSSLTRDKAAIVSRLAQRLDEVLPCFTLGASSTFSTDCNPGFVMIEAVQIEGHTDNVGADSYNRTLSTNRANSTFFAMTGAAKGVMQHLNLKRQPVLSVAAYGPDRPVASNDTPDGRATNRRIDLRFIMVTPQDTDGIEVIRKALQSVGEQQ